MIKRENTQWGKEVNRDEAYDLGFMMGVQSTLDFLAEEELIKPFIISHLLDQEYFKRIKALDK